MQRRLLLGGLLATIAAPGWARPPRAAFATLAREAPADVDPSGWLVSEKYDGVRALWDGRRLVFRSGLPVAAPAWFIARLPATALDGELWFGRGRFEALVSTVRKAVPVDDEWSSLRYMVFDLPGAEGPFAERAARIQALARSLDWAPLVAVAQSTEPDRAALARRLDAVCRAVAKA